jgi:hypothetical protein
LFTKLFSEELDRSFTFLNIFGRYVGNNLFWNRLFDSSCIWLDSLIMGCDMNFTTSRGGIWCSFPREDVLVNYFLNKFELVGLVDVEPIPLLPTWCNNRVEPEVISKRMDCFLIHQNLM